MQLYYQMILDLIKTGILTENKETRKEAYTSFNLSLILSK